MTEPRLETEWLMTLHGRIAEPAPAGANLLVFNVLEARMEGSGFRAELIAPSGDWIRVAPNGDWKLDVRLIMRADDGEHVYCHYNGIVAWTPTLQDRVARGETIHGDEIYFRSAPYFETASEKYAWLNRTLAIGKLREFGGGEVVYDLFKVL
ncbi:MAG: hypothetical protein CMN28_16180 [Salinisphaeraceae bacterium]|nr:hypothetical protein [Salinisphaeraceae bacterium]